jgi:hypothetical protein
MKGTLVILHLLFAFNNIAGVLVNNHFKNTKKDNHEAEKDKTENIPDADTLAFGKQCIRAEWNFGNI